MKTIITFLVMMILGASVQKDLAILNSLPAQMQPAIAPVKGAIESYVEALDAQRYTDSTSRGIGVSFSF